MFNVDGTMNKATKRPLFGYLKLDILDSESDEYISIVNVGLISRKEIPTYEDQ